MSVVHQEGTVTDLHGLAGRMATEGVPGLAAGEITDNIFRAWQFVE